MASFFGCPEVPRREDVAYVGLGMEVNGAGFLQIDFAAWPSDVRNGPKC